MKQNIHEVVTDKRSIPSNTNGTGTVVTHGIAIVGTSTLFTTEMPAGSYLVDETNWEVRKVVRVDSDTLAFLEFPFTNDLASAAPSIISRVKAKAIEINLVKVSGVVLLDNVALTGPLKLQRNGKLVRPVIVDATGGSLEYDVMY